MKILFITNIPSPYRVNFFNELGKKCELTVIFEREESKERNEVWKEFKFDNFIGIFLKGWKYKKDRAFSFQIIKYIKKRKYDWIIVSNIASPTGILAVISMNIKGIRYSIEGDGAFVALKENRIKNVIKHFVIGNAEACLSTCDNMDAYYLKYGAKMTQIYRYSFSSLFSKDILERPSGFEERNLIKKTLKIKEEKVILTVGRVEYVKGIDILLDATSDISKDIGIIIAGVSQEEADYQFGEKAKKSNLHFVGFQRREILEKYYRIADIFVMPTRGDVWGLAVNEAMANGLPIISSRMCNAGLVLVSENKNGYLFESGNYKELAEKILLFFQATNRDSMRECSIARIQHYTIENMSNEHLIIFRELKDKQGKTL